MKLGIMQPYFFPYIGYFQLINAVDKYVIYDDVQFIKGGWINRNYILLNGDKHLINLYLSGASSNKTIKEIQVQLNQSKLIKTIESSYKKAPMFNQVFPLFVKIMEFENLKLGSFLGNSIAEICKYLDIQTELIFSSEIQKENTLKGQDKVLHICELLNAEVYINAIGGKTLYKKSEFEKNNIKLNFLESSIKPYSQFNHEFIPGLSIIDVMMFNSVEEINLMLDNYSLI